MKDAAELLWEEIEAEALALEERVQDLTMEIPADAKGMDALLEEILDKLRKGTKSTVLAKK